MAEPSSVNPYEGEQLGEEAGLTAPVNALHVESSSQIKFQPQTEVIKLSKAHEALPHVYRVLQNGLVHDTRAKASLVANHTGSGSRGLVNYDSDGSSTPTQASCNASLAKKAQSLSKTAFPLAVRCAIVDENGDKVWVFQDELVLKEQDISLKAMNVAAKRVREAATPEDRLARLSEMNSLVDRLRYDVEQEQHEFLGR